MRAEPSIRRFVSDPIDRYIARRAFVIWCASPTLAGTTFWGSLDAREAAELVELWEYSRALADQHDAIVDASRLRSVDRVGYRQIVGYVRSRTDYGDRVRKQFVVTPRDDISGPMVAGLPTFLRLRFDWQLFGSLVEGLRWLGRGDADRACAEIAPVIDQAVASSQALHEVRAHVAREPLGATLRSVSRALGRSERSLQRELSTAGTSFRNEVRHARAHAAAILLADTDLKLEAVARKVGYASMSHFASAFRDVIGEPPLAYRQARAKQVGSTDVGS
jgi:AraC-like DNA-binding protein